MDGLDPRKLFGDDAQGFADELQKGATSGSFNPFAMIQGAPRFRAVFLGPLSPTMKAGIQQFLADGSGPLAGVVEQFQGQGLEPAAAKERAREVLSAAVAAVVVVLASDQGLTTVPQLFYGVYNDEYRDAVVAAFREDFADRDAVRQALDRLAQRLQNDAEGHTLFVAADGEDDPGTFWGEIGEEAIQGIDEGIMPQSADKLAETGYWIAQALRACRQREKADGHALLTEMRCWCLAGDSATAASAGDVLLADFEPEDEDLLKALEHLTRSAVQAGTPDVAVDFFARRADDIDQVLGGIYEWELARFRAEAAAQVSADQLLAAAERLQKADKRSFKPTLNKEPVWRVAVSDPGELLDTAAAADRIDRSVTFVAKRMEAGTIPTWHDGEQLRIPAAALDAWQAVMERYAVLD